MNGGLEGGGRGGGRGAEGVGTGQGSYCARSLERKTSKNVGKLRVSDQIFVYRYFYPSGTPKRWAEPTAMSTPKSPGGLSIVRDIRSVAATTSVPD